MENKTQILRAFDYEESHHNFFEKTLKNFKVEVTVFENSHPCFEFQNTESGVWATKYPQDLEGLVRLIRKIENDDVIFMMKKVLDNH